MTGSLRRWWLRIHRWLALSVGWVLACVALMGALLVLVGPLDRYLHPELFRARSGAAAASAALEPVRQRLLAEFGPATALGFRLPRAPGATLAVTVKAHWSGTVYVDPATGLEQGRRGETEGVRNLLFKLHSSLGLGDIGKATLASIALVYLLLLLTGVVLWWPRRWPPSLKIELRKGALRGMFDLHRTGGTLLGLLIAVSVATGAYMAWRPLHGAVTTLAGERAVKPPKLPKLDGGNHSAPDLDAMLARARAALPGAPVSIATLPAHPDRPLRIRLIVPDDPHPNGLSSVWLDPRTGELLGTNRWNTLDPGARVVAIVYPLHTGELGGPVLEVLVLLNGLALATLGVTGVWLWWKRRPRATAPALARSETR
jgi:uncharacterized iron-regulated membrane protein